MVILHFFGNRFPIQLYWILKFTEYLVVSTEYLNLAFIYERLEKKKAGFEENYTSLDIQRVDPPWS